jgi:SAM-dependent methyltransferase
MLTFHHNCYRQLSKKLLDSEEWPKAIDDQLLEPTNKIQRAHSILSLMVGPHILNQTESLLDFGCGTGETVKVAPEYGIKKAIGYDVRPAEGVTTSFREVRSKGPYDVVIVNDVLDHLVDETAHEAVSKISSVIGPESRVFIRCHPYCSRTGTHLPLHGINKAYAHFFFPELKGIHTNFILNPVHNYRAVFANNQLEIEHELLCHQEVEGFFQKHEQMRYILQNALKSKEFIWHLGIQYAEFMLRQCNPRIA